jgi:chromate transporter
VRHRHVGEDAPVQRKPDHARDGTSHDNVSGFDVTVSSAPRVSLVTIAREWGRLGIIGFGGPPTHIVLLRRLCVEERGWLPPNEFEDGIAATNLLPGPASTQLAIYCAWRLRGAPGALLGGICFICPGLAIILALAAVFLAPRPPHWIEGVAAGAGSAVPAVALSAALALVPSSWRRTEGQTARELRWIAYFAVGAAAVVLAGPLVVVAILGCGLLEFSAERDWSRRSLSGSMLFGAPTAATTTMVAGGLGALTLGRLQGRRRSPTAAASSSSRSCSTTPWSTYHWMTNAQFLNAVALGQVTPGPVVQTVAVVGYAASRSRRRSARRVSSPSLPSFLFRHRRGAPPLRPPARRAGHGSSRFLTGAGAAVNRGHRRDLQCRLVLPSVTSGKLGSSAWRWCGWCGCEGASWWDWLALASWAWSRCCAELRCHAERLAGEPCPSVRPSSHRSSGAVRSECDVVHSTRPCDIALGPSTSGGASGWTQPPGGSWCALGASCARRSSMALLT